MNDRGWIMVHGIAEGALWVSLDGAAIGWHAAPGQEHKADHWRRSLHGALCRAEPVEIFRAWNGAANGYTVDTTGMVLVLSTDIGWDCFRPA